MLKKLTLMTLIIFNFNLAIAASDLSKTDDIVHLKSPDHYGLTVPDIEEASLWFQEVFGAVIVDNLGPIFVPGGWMTENLNVPAKAVIRKVTLLEIPGQFFIELFDYSVSDQKQEISNNSDIGGHHIGFNVDDIEMARQQLIDKGIKVLGEVKTIKAGPYTIKWVYFMTPWGTSLELVEKER